MTATQELVKNQDNQSKTKITGRGGPRGGGRPVGSVSEATKQRKVLEATLKELASVHTVEALGTLVSIMKNGANPPASRVAAASQILDRGHGKASQTTVVTGDPANPININVTSIELRALISCDESTD